MIKNDFMKELENTLMLTTEEVEKSISTGNIDEAKEIVNKGLKSIIGIDIGTVDIFSFNSLERFIANEMHYNAEKFIAFGCFMKLQGLISGKENKENSQIDYYEKAIESFYKAYNEDDEINPKYLDDAAYVAKELSKYESSLDIDKKILRIYELANKLDKAEDTLFYMIRKTNNDVSIILEGIKFYNRLKEMNHDKLKKGNLPLEEVEDGLLELERRLEM
nr:DUF6483 family protein [Clostridium chromiireducens]